MELRLRLFEGHAFLGSRAVAFRVRTEAERALRSDPKAVVVLDCDRVSGVSHSFADELLSPLFDLLGKKVAERVSLINCAASVYADLASVAEMHRLVMPAPGEGCVVKHYA